MNEFKKPTKVNFFCYNKYNFPFIEDTFEALDTYTILCQIVKYLNQVIENLNINEDNIESLYTDFNNFKNYVEEYLSHFDINKINQQIEEKFQEIEQRNQTEFDNMNAEIEKLKLQVKNDIDNLKLEVNNKMLFILEYVDSKNDTLKIYVDDEIKKLREEIRQITFDKVKIINPVFGTEDNIQNVINDLYIYLRYGGITVLDFDVTALTCREFENLNLTALEFDLYSKYKIKFDLIHNMYSPFTRRIYTNYRCNYQIS